ncbi:hypothetical protein BAE29_07305 [Acidithiobacillus caldus]|jgi:hypothetical protein|nr:hypothetical protein BAE29_07305 [Acidithiobacillus caldus]
MIMYNKEIQTCLLYFFDTAMIVKLTIAGSVKAALNHGSDKPPTKTDNDNNNIHILIKVA